MSENNLLMNLLNWYVPNRFFMIKNMRITTKIIWARINKSKTRELWGKTREFFLLLFIRALNVDKKPHKLLIFLYLVNVIILFS